MDCNFKFIESDGKRKHVLSIEVVCVRITSLNGCTYGYRIQAFVVDDMSTVYFPKTDWLNTPKEAFSLFDKISKKYPRYGDDRDCNIDLAPLYEGVEERQEERQNDV